MKGRPVYVGVAVLCRYISRFRRQSKMESEAAYYFTQMVGGAGGRRGVWLVVGLEVGEGMGLECEG